MDRSRLASETRLRKFRDTERRNFGAVVYSYQMVAKERDRSYANAVVRACDVLKAFRHERETVGLAEVVERTQLSKTTVFRLLQSLVRGGLVERAGKGVYSSRISPTLARSFRLGFAAQTDSAFSREVTNFTPPSLSA